MSHKKNQLHVDRIIHLIEVIQNDIELNKYFGAVISVAQGVEIILQDAFGFTEKGHKRPLFENSIFSLFSLTKAFTNAMVLRVIEPGQFAFISKMSEILPEFSGGECEMMITPFMNKKPEQV